LCAPGDNITSTHTLGLTATPCASPPRFADYATLDGTSFSAPLVASAVALVQSYRRQQGLKLLTPQSMRLRLMETADDISGQNPARVGQIGAGRLNVFRALTDPPGSWADRLISIPAPGVVVLPSISGRARVAFVTSDRHLLVLSGVAGDTLLDVGI